MKVVRLFPRFFNDEMNEIMESKVTKEELKVVLRNFKKAKSPGPGGWTMEFFLEDELFRVIGESRRYGKMLGDLNATFITLIPKKNDPSTFDDFRSISLCNLIYKTISKIIANRMKQALSNSISEQQFGFLFNRQFHDTIGIAWEGFHSIKI
jgi:hypothetical protein